MAQEISLHECLTETSTDPVTMEHAKSLAWVDGD